LANIFSLFLIILFVQGSFADTKGLVKIYKGRELYVEYTEAAPGQPTVVLLNGMTYSTRQWDKFVAQFKEKNPTVGVLAYDMYGMGQTLLKYHDDFVVTNPAKIGRIHFQEQARELQLLLKNLSVPGPIHLLGLSYGGGVAQYFMNEYADTLPIKSAILMSPYVVPLKSQVDWIQYQISLVRFWQPYNMWSDEVLYDYFLRQLVFTTYPFAEPIVLENPYKLEATYRLAQGMKNFDGLEWVNSYAKHSIHLLQPMMDEYIDQQTYEDFWAALPKSARASRFLIKGARHKLPEELPGLMTEWVSRLINDKTGKYYKGKTFSSKNVKAEYKGCEPLLAQ